MRLAAPRGARAAAPAAAVGPPGSAPRPSGAPGTPPRRAGSPSGPSRTGWSRTAASRVYFCTGPENLFQLEQWRRPLEHLARTRPTFVVVDQPDTGPAVLERSTLPVAFAQGSGALERLVDERDVRVVLYVNQVERNFRMLRFAGPVHVQLGHGESDKAYSVSNQHKAYDLTFVGGQAGRDRLGAALRGFDAGRADGRGRPAAARPRLPGRPGLVARRAACGSGTRRPGRATGRASRTGPWSATASRSSRRWWPTRRSGVIYRPHPRTGLSSPRARRGRPAVRAVLARDGRPSSGRRRAVRLAVGLRRRVRHRPVLGRLRLAGHRQAARRHRAGGGRGLPAGVPAARRAAAAAGRTRPGRCSTCCASAAWAAARAGPDPLLADLSRYYFGETRRRREHAVASRRRSTRPGRWPQPAPGEGRTRLRARAGSPRRRRGPWVDRVRRAASPRDSAVGRPKNNQPSEPASGRQITATAQSQRGARRTAYGGAWATSTTQ